MPKLKYGTKAWFESMFMPAHQGYDLWGHQWRATQKYRYLLTLKTIAPILVQKGFQSILDVGCGLGDFTYMAYQTHPQNCFFGMDISKNAVSGANKIYPDIEFKQGELPQIAFDDKFDGIFALDCLCYLDNENRRAALNNIRLHLKSGGWFLFSTPIDDGRRYFSVQQAMEVLDRGGFNSTKTIYNHARLYKGFENFFLNVRDLSIILQVAENDSYNNLTPKKKKLYHLIEIPVIGTLLKAAIKLSNYFSYRILKSLCIVRLFQWISQTFLANWGISHLIVLSFKK